MLIVNEHKCVFLRITVIVLCHIGHKFKLKIDFLNSLDILSKCSYIYQKLKSDIPNYVCYLLSLISLKRIDSPLNRSEDFFFCYALQGCFSDLSATMTVPTAI